MYRNNLVRTALSVLSACTLLYIASSSAQSSTQLNSPALTQEFSDAPVATSLGPLLSEDITGDESYTPEVITMRQATATEEAPTMTLAQAEPELPQLDTPTSFLVGPFEGGLSTAGLAAQGVDRYIFKLYLGVGTSSTALDTRSIQNNLLPIAIHFGGLEPGTQYTVEIIARADNYRDSNPRVVTVRTDKANINAPTANELRITEGTDNITVTFENTPIGVDGYALSIRKRFDDMEIAKSTQNVTISDSPITFTDLLPDRAYTLMALPTFESERYEYSAGIVSLDFMTAALPAFDPGLTAAFVASRQGTSSRRDLGVAWNSPENDDDIIFYRITLYERVKSSGDFVSFGVFRVMPPTTDLMAGSFPLDRFFTASITLVPDIYSLGESLRVSVLPPKLLREFFTVTPSSTSLSLAWDSSFDDSLSDGVYFYDATYIDPGNDLASSLLLISIEDLNGNEIAGPEEVGTRADVYSMGGLSQATSYVLSIVHRVTVSGTSLSSEALEISFNTLEALPEPTGRQISSTVEGTTLIVNWDNAAEGVTNYDLTLVTAEGAVIGTPKEVNALMAGSTTFIGLDLGTAYTLSVVAKGDASVYAPSPPYRVSVYQPQLDTPMISVIGTNGVTPVVIWMRSANVENYTLRLYLGDDTSGQVLRRREFPSITAQTYSPVLLPLEPLTQYTVELIAQATGYRNSNPATSLYMSGKGIINAPTESELVITPSTDNITVTFEDTQPGVNGYALSIRKRFGDMGIAQSMQNFTISDSPIAFTDLLPDRAYTLMALPTFESERYEYSGGTVSLDFMTADLLLSNPENVTASFVARRLGSLTLSDIRIAWEPVENAQSYLINSYEGESNNRTSFATLGKVFAPATELLAGNYFFDRFLTVSVTAESDIYINSEEVFAPILPPKLSREFFIVTPSATLLSLAWDSSRDASLQTGGDSFYDSTFIGRLGSSASSLLLISIEDLDGNQIAEPEEVGTGADTYSRGGLSDATRYVVKIVHRVTVGDTSRSSEALEIKFIASASLRLRLRAFLEGPLQ